MKNRILSIMVLFLISSGIEARGGGISVDAGLTPAQDRFILRTQYRYMSRDNSMMTAKAHMMPMVVAYGITSGISVMARGMYVHRTMGTESFSGLNDLYMLSKFRLFRKNTANYVLGIAPHIASNIPVGSNEISERTWNPEIGLNISFRPRFYSIDISTSYEFSDVLGKSETDFGNIYNLNLAVSSVIPFKNKPENAISPVLEINYAFEGGYNNEKGPNNEILYLSPGLSFIHSSLVLEAIIQYPVYQKSASGVMNQNSRLILGVRYML